MAGHKHPLTIPDHFYKPIGQIIVGWNLTDALLASIIWKLHRIRNVRKGRVLVYGLKIGDKLKLLARSAKHFTTSPAVHEDLRDLQRRANTLKDQRNLLAHGLWGRMPKDSQWKVFKLDEMDDDLLLIRKKVPEEVNPLQVAHDVMALNRDLKKFMVRHRIPPP
jgi:hypothetical protein